LPLANKKKFSTTYSRIYPPLFRAHFTFLTVFSIFFASGVDNPMLSNYYTLLHVARSLNDLCSSFAITEIYSQEKNKLCLVIGPDPVRTVVISCDPSRNYIYLHAGRFRAKKNSVDLLHEAVAETIRSVWIEPADRVISFALSNNCIIRAEFFASRANVFLSKPDSSHRSSDASIPYLIADAFLRRKDMLGQLQHCTFVNGSTNPSPVIDESLFIGRCRTSPASPVAAAVKQLLPVLGSTLVKEILHRVGIHPDSSTSLMTDGELRRIHSTIQDVVNDVLHSNEALRPRIYLDNQLPLCFSLIPLQTFEDFRYELFSDIHSGIHRFVAWTHASSDFRSSKQDITTWIEKELDKLQRTLEKIDTDADETVRAHEYEQCGKLLMTHLHELRKGMKEYRLHSSERPLFPSPTISLDPARSPVQNAELYFEKAKRAHVAYDDQQKRGRVLQDRLRTIRSLQLELDELYSFDGLKRFLSSHEAVLKELGFLSESEKENVPPFRRFVVDGGFVVFVGKSSENNDLLTTKFARPDDLWFHSRGSSGSHVVLRIDSGKGTPSKLALQQAAAIAAYYSKMKNASSVPVAMTEKKFVRKPKGAPVGSVVIEREKVLFVEPKLPD
jgi:predicted ribosome quality control (RQC) complex YloA/Tae2 family protein